MDVRQAIDSHVEWKNRLAAYLVHPDQSLDPAVIALDDHCDLGRWLRGEGTAESGWVGFAQLVRDHARFHAEAANLVRRADAGERIAEEVALGSKSEYAKASNAVTTALLLIKSKRKQAARAWNSARFNSELDGNLAIPSIRLCGETATLAVVASPCDSTPRGERAASWPGE
jgi:Chemoreceptor zinc-binding domain